MNEVNQKQFNNLYTSQSLIPWNNPDIGENTAWNITNRKFAILMLGGGEFAYLYSVHYSLLFCWPYSGMGMCTLCIETKERLKKHW
jgi:hypothetical protein